MSAPPAAAPNSTPDSRDPECRWAALYDTDQLISVKSFDFRRTAASCLETALRIAGASAGVLALLDHGRDLEVAAARGVDAEAILEDPRLAPLCEAALERSQPGGRGGFSFGPSLPAVTGPADVLCFPLRLALRPLEAVPKANPNDRARTADRGTNGRGGNQRTALDGPTLDGAGGDPADSASRRERRRHPEPRLAKPLGVLVLAGPAGSLEGGAPSPARLTALSAYAQHTAEVLVNARLYHQATHDPLTDLYRRPELEHHLEVETTLARHVGTPLALLMVDIDELGRINQTEGRGRGDKVIARVARLVRAQVREGDACFRYGGEEFAVVLPGGDPEGALAASEKIRRAVEEYPGFGVAAPVRVSVGVAVFPHHADGPAQLLRKADQTLFIAKQEGGNRAVLWHRRIPSHALRSDKLIGILTGNQAKDYRNVMLLLDTIVVVNSVLERRQVLETLLDMLIQLSGCERGLLYLTREGGLELELAQDTRGRELAEDAPPVCEELLARVVRQGLPLAVRAHEEDDSHLAEACRALGLQLAIALPLLVKGKQIGCMYFDATRPNPELDESDLIFMRALARELGNALEKSRLYQENLEQKSALEDLTARLAEKVQAQASELADLERNLSELKLRYNYDRIVGKSEPMQRVFKLLDRITDTDVPVLVQGETGTGKELVARALHLNGPRRDRAFVSVNCSAVSESLMESELFGHVRGAFTGADRDKPGLFEQAHEGTIFLDEIQDMSPGMQRELLRVLQEGEIRRVGGKEIIHVDVRVISATNKDLRQLVTDGEFRQDLFYRLNVVSIELPPLRDRKEDIPLIVQRLIEEARTLDGRPVKLSRDALRAIMRYDWPGNVRQLQNLIEKTVLLIEGDTIEAEHVHVDVEGGAPSGISRMFELDYGGAKDAFTREYLKALLARNAGVVTRAANEAGIVRSSFHKLMRKHGIQAKDFGTARAVTHD